MEFKEIDQKDIYKWPNPAFPFSCFFNGNKCRIFFIENISHNYDWFDLYQNKIRNTDYFFVVLGWNFSEHLARHAAYTIEKFKLDKNKIFILYNSPEEEVIGQNFKLNGFIMNHNALLDIDILKPLNTKKKYNALYIARPVQFKRHYLASKISKLALAAGGNLHKDEEASLPRHINQGSKFYSKTELAQLINQSHCGLALSAEEGACYSSSEYLLCGVPVVSTESVGGRDVWYNESNSIICKDNADAVAQAVALAANAEWDARLIRRLHLEQAMSYRKVLIEKINSILSKHYKSFKPNISKLFKNLNWYCNPNSNGCKTIHDLNIYFK